MPYKIVYRPTGDGRPWKIVNKDTNKQVGSSKTRKEAEASVRARHAAKEKKS